MNIEQFYSNIGLQLKKVGTRWKSICPFHRESDASFTVYPDGSYHCFGCGAHGNAKDIQELFDLDYQLFPDITNIMDPLVKKLYELKSKMEDDLTLFIIDKDYRIKFKAYDMFDMLIMDARALTDQVETTLVDLVAFMKHKFEEIFRIVEKQ